MTLLSLGKWITVPSICAALILAPASGVLAGTQTKHHKAKKPAATHKAATPAPASATVAAPKTEAMAKTAVKHSGAKKHVAAMSAATKKVAPASTKSVAKHKTSKHAGAKSKKPVAKVEQPKPAEDFKTTDSSMSAK